MEKDFLIYNNHLILLRYNKPQPLFTFHYFKKEVPGYEYCEIDNLDNFEFALLDINNCNITEILVFKSRKNKGYIGAATKNINIWYKFYYKNRDKLFLKEDKKFLDEKKKYNPEISGNYNSEISKKYINYSDNFSDIKKRKNYQKKRRCIRKNFRIYSKNKNKKKGKKGKNFRKNFKSEFFNEFVNYENQINEMWDIYDTLDHFDFYKDWDLSFFVID